MATHCPKCATANSATAKFCKSCGCDLRMAVAAAPEIPSGSACRQCHAVNAPTAKFCKSCGASIAKATPGRAVHIGFEKTRQDEISAVTKTQQEAIAALAPLSASKQVRAGEIKTVEVSATDKSKNETRKFQAFDSVSIDIPLSTKGTPEYDAAIGKLKTLAERVADERGSASIELAMTANDARASKVTLETASAQTAKGNPITVSKFADNSIPKGMQRVTVRAGKIPQTLV